MSHQLNKEWAKGEYEMAEEKVKCNGLEKERIWFPNTMHLEN